MKGACEYVCVCVALCKAHAALELIAGKTWVHQPSLSFCSFWPGEGGAAKGEHITTSVAAGGLSRVLVDTGR